jgi:hypothetical protein
MKRVAKAEPPCEFCGELDDSHDLTCPERWLDEPDIPPDAGIEVKRPVVSIQDVDEARLSHGRKLALTDYGDGIKDSKALERAEEELIKAIRRFLKHCPWKPRLRKIVDDELNG